MTPCATCSNAERHLERLVQARQAAASSGLNGFLSTDATVVSLARGSLREWVSHLRKLTDEDAGDHVAKHVADRAALRHHEAKVLLHVMQFDDQVIADTIAFEHTGGTHVGPAVSTERLRTLWDAVERRGLIAPPPAGA
jgi:hypothetical protein